MKYFQILGSESSKLMGEVSDFLSEAQVVYQDIENIVVVVGPGSFTGIRTTILYVNTLSFIFPHVFLTGLSFFDLYSLYPIIKTSSKRDLFVQKEKGAIIEILRNEEVLDYIKHNSILSLSGDSVSEIGDVQIFSDIDYEAIVRGIVFTTEKTLTPLYIKKPNIS